MLLLAVVILSVVTVPPAGGSLSAVGRVRLRYAPAIFGALAWARITSADVTS